MYGFNLEDGKELEAIKDVMDGAYKDDDVDLDDLLDDAWHIDEANGRTY